MGMFDRMFKRAPQPQEEPQHEEPVQEVPAADLRVVEGGAQQKAAELPATIQLPEVVNKIQDMRPEDMKAMDFRMLTQIVKVLEDTLVKANDQIVAAEGKGGMDTAKLDALYGEKSSLIPVYVKLAEAQNVMNAFVAEAERQRNKAQLGGDTMTTGAVDVLKVRDQLAAAKQAQEREARKAQMGGGTTGGGQFNDVIRRQNSLDDVKNKIVAAARRSESRAEDRRAAERAANRPSA